MVKNFSLSVDGDPPGSHLFVGCPLLLKMGFLWNQISILGTCSMKVEEAYLLINNPHFLCYFHLYPYCNIIMIITYWNIFNPLYARGPLKDLYLDPLFSQFLNTSFIVEHITADQCYAGNIWLDSQCKLGRVHFLVFWTFSNSNNAFADIIVIYCCHNNNAAWENHGKDSENSKVYLLSILIM